MNQIVKSSLSLVRKALCWRNRADGDNKESMFDRSKKCESETRENSCAKKLNFFPEINEPKTEISVPTPSPTK